MNLLEKCFPKVSIGNEDAPAIAEQTDWPTGFYQFPNQHSGIEYFNCGLVTWNNNEWLVTRRRQVFVGSVGHNDIMLWLLKDNVPTRGYPARINVSYGGEHHEDPRAINVNGNLLVSYTNFKVRGSFAHQGVVALNQQFQGFNPVHIVHGKNGAHLKANSGHEKNWIWFLHDGDLHFVYTTLPHVVCRVKGLAVDRIYETEKFNWKWSHGEPRGGTPPVKVGDFYYTFFHSSLPNKRFRSRYYMGALRFSATAPFTIDRMTNAPLLAGSEYDPRNPSAPLVVFPCGSKFDGREWLVTMGINDTACAWIRIPHTDLMKRMERCE